MTVTIGASSLTSGAQVRYTCVDGGKIATCGPDVVSSVWTKKVTVPIGTVMRVKVAVNGAVLPPNCWIADETDHLIFDEGKDGTCEAEIK